MTINDIRNEGMTGVNAVSLVTDVASVVLPIVPAGVSHALRAAKIANKLADTADAAAEIINDYIPGSEWTQEKNIAWIKQMKEEGCTIWDIGPDFCRRLDNVDAGIKPVRRIDYEIERRILKGYDKLRKNFFRLKDLGGIPGLDF